jgi:hypothetical protein
MTEPAPASMGRASIYRGKKGGDRVQGILTRDGSRLFQMRRKRLASLTRRPMQQVSDADVIEWMARGCPPVITP